MIGDARLRAVSPYMRNAHHGWAAAFLSAVRVAAPDTVRIFVTGQVSISRSGHRGEQP